MIALIASEKRNVESLILCSPSGYFLEYDKILTDDDRVWADTELADFRDFSAAQTIQNARVEQGVLLAGENELEHWPDFKQWVKDLRHQTGWQYIQISNTGREIEAAAYRAEIRQVVHELARSASSSTTNF